MATGSILVIDDDEGIRRLLRQTLRLAGYTVTEASSGATGLASYQAEPADLVITDIVMPDSEGLQTIRALRKLNTDVKIIAMSGQRADYLDLAQKFGAQQILQKPFLPDQLLEAVSTIFGEH